MPNRIGLHHLRAYQAVMAGGSVTAAAERLNLTQSTISKQILSLEQQLKVRLFDRRSGRLLAPTREGIAFFKAVEGTISALNEIDGVAQDIARHGRRRLRLAATPPLINSQVVMRTMRRFLEQFPGVEVALEPRHRLDIEDWLAHRQIDIALALLPATNPTLRTIPLIEIPAVAVLAQTHPLAAQDRLCPRLVAGERLILPSHQPMRTRIDAALERLGFPLAATLQSSSTLTCCRLASEGLGIAICDPFSPTAFPGQGLVVRPWDPEVRLTYGVLLSPEMRITDAAEAFLDLLKGELEVLGAAR